MSATVDGLCEATVVKRVWHRRSCYRCCYRLSSATVCCSCTCHTHARVNACSGRCTDKFHCMYVFFYVWSGPLAPFTQCCHLDLARRRIEKPCLPKHWTFGEWGFCWRSSNVPDESVVSNGAYAVEDDSAPDVSRSLATYDVI